MLFKHSIVRGPPSRVRPRLCRCARLCAAAVWCFFSCPSFPRVGNASTANVTQGIRCCKCTAWRSVVAVCCWSFTRPHATGDESAALMSLQIRYRVLRGVGVRIVRAYALVLDAIYRTCLPSGHLERVPCNAGLGWRVLLASRTAAAPPINHHFGSATQEYQATNASSSWMYHIALCQLDYVTDALKALRHHLRISLISGYPHMAWYTNHTPLTRSCCAWQGWLQAEVVGPTPWQSLKAGKR